MSELFILTVFFGMLVLCYFAGEAYFWMRRLLWLRKRRKRFRTLPSPRRKAVEDYWKEAA